jgi:hypothetical protein
MACTLEDRQATTSRRGSTELSNKQVRRSLLRHSEANRGRLLIRGPGFRDKDDLKTVGVDERYTVLLPVRICRLDREPNEALQYLVDRVSAAKVKNEQRLRMW